MDRDNETDIKIESEREGGRDSQLVGQTRKRGLGRKGEYGLGLKI